MEEGSGGFDSNWFMLLRVYAVLWPLKSSKRTSFHRRFQERLEFTSGQLLIFMRAAHAHGLLPSKSPWSVKAMMVFRPSLSRTVPNPSYCFGKGRFFRLASRF